MAKRPKKTVDILLREISVWDTLTLASLDEYKKPEFDEYVFHSTPYNCGCWHTCDCPRDKIGFFGRRLETDQEHQDRLKKEDAESLARQQKQEQEERKTLEKLKEKYKE